MLEDIIKKLDDFYAVKLTKEMIGIPSVTGEEEALSLYIKDKLESYGMETELQYAADRRPNVYGVMHGDGPCRRLNFNVHTDTVPAGDDWKTDPFTAKVIDGKIYGRGACDMKSGIACTLNMLRAVANSGAVLDGELSFSGVVDQEATDIGACAMMEDAKWRTLDGIVLSYSYCGNETKPIPLGLTGKILYDVNVKGKAAHGFRPHLGVNAVEDAARIIANLDKLKLMAHPEFGRGTVCTLKTEGGYRRYSVVVPESARFEVNRLLVPGESIGYALEDMERLVRSLDLNSEVKVGIKPPKYEPYIASKDEPLMTILDRAYSEVMGRPPLYEFAYGITNANIFQGEHGIQCVHLGPERGNAHGPNEHVKLEWLPPISKMYAIIAHHFLGGCAR
ncbi:MAG: M20 family metallopeptidase [Candidatus Bathyarchaeota archaeon]|nr:MAG: M20 family metallopeptidase [Candidatus Bathyarchaeota archaeon]